MKNTILIITAIFASTLIGAQTIYQTIDIGGGVINWSTDGGVTDCGCLPDYGDKHDEIYVYHPYTFNTAFFNGNDIEAYFEINTNVAAPVVFEGFINKRERSWLIKKSTVTFNDGVFSRLKSQGQNSQIIRIDSSIMVCNGSYKIDETTALITESDVTFNSSCEVFGTKNSKAGNMFVSANSHVLFSGNLYGDETGEGTFTFDASDCEFEAGISILAVRMDVNENAVLTVKNGVTINTSEIRVKPNSTIVMLNNITVLGSVLIANTANLALGTGAIFQDGTVLDFGDNVTGFFWGSTSFDDVEILLKSGCVMGFESGLEIANSFLSIEDGAISQFIDASIDNCYLNIGGVLASDSTTSITGSDIVVNSTGIIDLTFSYYCDFNNSKVNNKKASSELDCGQSFSPDDSQFYIWENGVWSQGTAPDGVGLFVEIKDNYSTSMDGNISCGHLTIDDSLIVNIDSLGFIRCTQSFNNFGHVVVRNKGSLLMDRGAFYASNNGVTTVTVLGYLSAMQYNLWSTPIIDTLGILTRFPNTNPCDIFVFEAPSQTWKYDYEPYTETVCGIPPDTQTVVFSETDVIYNANGSMDVGLGYFVPGNDKNALRSFTGRVNNGTIVQTIQTTSIGDNPNWNNDDWNLLGNPYPSGLDLNNFWFQNADLTGALTDGIYFWVETQDTAFNQYGNYLVWNPMGGTYIPDTKNELSVVPPGMGFWVLANDVDALGTWQYDIVFDNSMRSVLRESPVSHNYNFQDHERHRMWVYLVNDSNEYDQILIGTHPAATDSIDLLYDAHKNYGGEPLAIATVVNQQAFTIHSDAPRTAVDTSEIKLVILASNESNHYLRIDSSAYYLDEKRVFLLDKLKNTEEELFLGQSVTLDIDSAGAYRNRFYLKVTNSHITGVSDVSNSLNGRIWTYGNEVMYDNFVNNISEISVYDLRGVQIYHSYPNNRNSKFSIPNLPEGIFIVKFLDDVGNQRVERFHFSTN